MITEKITTKDKLLNAAGDLMLAKGYVGTTVDEICAKAKLTKGCFFHYFESKEALAKALLTRTCSSHQKTKEELFGNDPLKRVYGQVDLAIEMSKSPAASKGCLKGAFAQELSDTHPEIRRICSEAFKNMAKDFSKDLAEAKAQYAPKASFNPMSVAEHFIAVLQGSFILSKAHQDGKYARQGLEHFKEYLKSLLKD